MLDLWHTLTTTDLRTLVDCLLHHAPRTLEWREQAPMKFPIGVWRFPG